MNPEWNQSRLYQCMREKKSALCIGLDTSPEQLPPGYEAGEKGWLKFNQDLIDQTRHLAVAYKPNLAFYEAYGLSGWKVLMETMRHIGQEHFIIADAKRGDIGNTAAAYARAIFTELGAHAVTLHPYLGYESVAPFLKYPGRVSIILGFTSNPGAESIQALPCKNNKPLFINILEQCKTWASTEQLMVVAGATQPDRIREIREILPDHTLLVPGVGVQGGKIEDVLEAGKVQNGPGLLINASRGISEAWKTGKLAGESAEELVKGMKGLFD